MKVIVYEIKIHNTFEFIIEGKNIGARTIEKFQNIFSKEIFKRNYNILANKKFTLNAKTGI